MSSPKFLNDLRDTLSHFPHEIWDHICSCLPRPSVLQLRLVSRQFNDVSLRWAFRTLYLDARVESVNRFAQIAKSAKLRELVQELTVDTWVDFDEYGTSKYPFPVEFMNALPSIRYFSKVTTLHVRFSKHCGNHNRDTSIEETWMFRYRVLDTVFHCITGLWTPKTQREIDHKANLKDIQSEYPLEEPDLIDEPIQLKELTITNLAGYHDSNVANSAAWKKFVSSIGLIDLKLFIIIEADEATPENSVFFEEQYEMFAKMPCTWLHHDLSSNLRVLSLYSETYWGWFPKMDFRLISSGDQPFPQLKVLALGNYVFTHDWQIEWFASLGKMNGSGGLEELFLDDCPILFEAIQFGFDGDDPLYPVVSEVFNSGWEDGWNPETRQFPLRWNRILSQWKDTMKGLKVFRMGSGFWGGMPLISHIDTSTDILAHRVSRQVHRMFDCPEFIQEDWENAKYADGCGISCTRPFRMQYISFDIGLGPTPWVEGGQISQEADVFAPEDGTIERDDHAYDMLMSTIRAR